MKFDSIIKLFDPCSFLIAYFREAEIQCAMWSFQKNISNILNSIYVEQKVELFSVYEDELKGNYENNARLFENKASDTLNVLLSN